MASVGSLPQETRRWRSIMPSSQDRGSGDGVTRFKSIAAHANRDQASLSATNPAVTGGTTLFQKSVFSADRSPRLLVSGHNSAKLGAVVLKGSWRGMPIYHLTLVERETCPTSCDLWRECFGNSMPLARRHRYTDALLPMLGTELAAKAAEAPQGFVVRLHVLGDFPDTDYIWQWAIWMRRIPQLHVFGYTHHGLSSEIGQMVLLLNLLHPTRWMVRFSVPPTQSHAPLQATTIWRQPEGKTVSEGIVCPAQTHATAACATCGLCWALAARDKRIVFIGHGMRKRGRVAEPSL